ncbi:MAG: D-alanine--poly(phosphoribitol) ligase subunit DltC [Liquorilactobacillus satsumensis]|uniref:D-alanine--poly(phosphoribitol) ligase subunit DltC n=1 Tax=Liquorilactobacillus satsumensis TaxID=259059 RepID=UPI0039EC70A0
MDVKQKVLSILKDLSGEDLSDQMDTNLYDTALMDSMATVQMMLELQNQLGIDVQISEFDRSEWDTPNKIIKKVEALVK